MNEYVKLLLDGFTFAFTFGIYPTYQITKKLFNTDTKNLNGQSI